MRGIYQTGNLLFNIRNTFSDNRKFIVFIVVLCQDNGHIKPFSKISKMYKLVVIHYMVCLIMRL